MTSSDIFFEIKYSILVSDLYGLIQRILRLIFFGPYCNITLPLENRCVITKGALIRRVIFVCSVVSEQDLSPTL